MPAAFAVRPEPELEPEPIPIPSPRVAPEPVRPRPAARRAANLDAVHNELIRAGVDERNLDRFLEGFAHGVAPFLEAGDAVRDAVRDYIASRLPVVRDWKPSGAGHTLAFVGQTGVGKTSAAACLAGRYRAAGLAVALVAAGDGPPRRPRGPRAPPRRPALPGRGRRRAGDAVRDARATATWWSSTPPGAPTSAWARSRTWRPCSGPAKVAEVHLVLPAAAAAADLGDVQRRFRLVGVNRLTLTKLDETRFHGNLLNLPMRMGKPLAFLSSGASVPGALAPARGRRVAEMLLP